MLCTLLLAAAPLQAAAAAPVTRSLTLSAYTKKAEPVLDLKPEEIQVAEAGQSRKVLGVERDDRPLAVAVVVDSSVVVGSSLRSDLVPAVAAFWKALPQGARLAVWTSGPPSKVVDFGTDLATAEPRLQMVAPAGKNYAFEAIQDAARGLGPPAGRRHVLVYVGSGVIEAGRLRSAEAMQALGQAAATPMIVLVLPGGALSTGPGGPTEGASFSWDVQGYFEKVAQAYRGTCAVVLSTQAAMKALQVAAADLAGQYRVRFESTTGVAGEPKVEVRRKGVVSRVGRTQVEVLKVE